MLEQAKRLYAGKLPTALNSHTRIEAEMWDLLIGPDNHLLGGFFKLWKDEGKLGPSFILIFQQKVTKNYDRIANLIYERTKRKDFSRK